MCSRGAWLDLSCRIAATPPDVKLTVQRAPASWVALLLYMGCEVESVRKVFETDGLALNCVNRLKMAAQFGTLTRTEVEIMCTTRPETIDGLWKLDNEWPKSKRLLAIPEQR